MDGDNRYCIGCKRTLGEISNWGSMSDAQQAAVLAQLPARRAKSDIAEVPAAPFA